MLTLNDGRTELWQWDTGRKLTVDADCSQVHFSNKVFGRSVDVDVIDGVAIVPDILLQAEKDLSVWAFVGTAENGYTKISKTFKVNRRNKPADYVFTPIEQTTIDEIYKIAKSIREDADDGKFDGAPGPTGPAGAPGKDNLPNIAATSDTEVTLTLDNNVEYHCTNAVTALTIEGFTPAEDGKVSMWAIQFAAGEGITVTLPDAVKWAIAEPVFTAGVTYWLSFVPLISGGILGVWVSNE